MLLSFDQHMEQSAREYLVHVLHRCDNNITRAAKMAGRNRTQFYRTLDQYGVKPKVRRGNWEAFGL